MTAKGRQLGFDESKQILEAKGIPIEGQSVTTLEEAGSAAEALGYPVVLKGIASKLVHKTDVGIVHLNLKTAKEVETAYKRIHDNAKRAGAKELDNVLVQKMAEPGFELLIGAKQDPCFGPVTMVGHGGRFVELFADVAPGVGKLNRDDVERMLSHTMAGRILKGFRGPPLDREAVIDLAIKISKLMDERPEINELDLNPVIVYEKGFAIVDARLIQGEPITYNRYTDLSYNRMRSLDAVFNPRSVAVVGASKHGTIGGIILKNSSRIQRLYPVNPKYETLQGRKSFPSLEALHEVPDVGVFVTNAERAVTSYEEFCKIGGRGAIIVSDGFAEIGRSDLEERLVEISEEHDTVYIGPNCLGVIDNFSGLNTMFVPEQRTALLRKPSGLGIISQSGGIGLELLEMLEADNLSVGRWVSCGNASGVAIAEILAHMGEDSRINLIALYIEGLKNAHSFMEVGRKVSREKPVIVIKGGVGGGAAATMSHTASLAGSFQAFRACCDQAGLYLIEELTEDPKILINLISILSTQPRARGNRVAVVSVGGGAAILLADQVTEEEMELAQFAPKTVERFQKLLGAKIEEASPGERGRIVERLGSNPVDLFGDCDDERLLEALRVLDADPNTDMILVALYFQVPYLTEYVTERLVDLSKEFKKPLIVSPRGFALHVQRCREYLYKQDFQTYTVPMVKPMAIACDIWKRYGRDFMEKGE
ncbi:MAG: acetate--CoA ligase family protein [Planctomycetota bacterium]|jgi:3-hydroxypropionyl-CoA synthetase (ADP-forming)